MGITKITVPLTVRQIEKENYHLFVTVRTGRYRCLLLVDTGASKTVFDSAKILRMVKPGQIREFDAHSVGLGSAEVKTHVVQLKTVRIGELTVRNMEVAVLDLSHVNQSYIALGIDEIDGVLGSDFFMKHKAIIDYGKKQLIVRG